MCRPWPSLFALLSLFLVFVQQSFACIDVLFVIDNKTLEVSRARALQVARQLPEDQQIRKWVVLSRNDRYVPRVLRNNAELLSVLSTIHGDYDRFLEIATGEISRRTATFQPFVILLFSETPVNQTMTNMWRSISLAPALHIYRIGSFQRTSKMLSEDQETDFEKLILCGRNKTDVFNTESSKFSGGNEIRRSPTSTPRPWTSTRDPFVRRLTFYDASRTLLDGKKKQEELKQQQLPTVNTKFIITRTFKKMTTKPMSTTRRTPTTTTRPTTTRNPYSNNRSSTKFDSKKHFIHFQTSTRKPFKWSTTSKYPKTTRTTINKFTTKRKFNEWTQNRAKITSRPAVSAYQATTRRPLTTTTRRTPLYSSRRLSTTTTSPYTTTRRTTYRPPSSTLSSRKPMRIVTSAPRTTKWWIENTIPNRGYQMFPTTIRPVNPPRIAVTTRKPQTFPTRNLKPVSSRLRNLSVPTTTKTPFTKPTITTRPVSTTTKTPYRRTTTKSKPTPPNSQKRTSSLPTTTRTPFKWTITRRNPILYTTTQRPQYTTRRTTTRKPFLPWWNTQTPRPTNRAEWHTTHSFATTPSPAPVSTIDFPPKKNEIEEIEQLNGKNFKVRSRSVHFAMTEKPPVTTVMNPMKFFTTTRTPITTARSLIPYSCTADVFFLVDLSQGTGDKSQQYLDIAASAISSLPISQETVRVGLISYSGPGRTHVRVYLDKHNEKEKLIEEMFLMERHGGTTRTADAIRYTTKIFEGMAHPARKNVKKVLVVFTDGYSQDNPRDAARVARAKGLQLIAVAVKDRLAPPDEVQLADIGGSSRNVFVSPNGRELREKIIGTQCRM